jgi:hypothetical protein
MQHACVHARPFDGCVRSTERTQQHPHPMSSAVTQQFFVLAFWPCFPKCTELTIDAGNDDGSAAPLWHCRQTWRLFLLLVTLSRIDLPGQVALCAVCCVVACDV